MSWLDKLLPRKDDGDEDRIVAMFNQWRNQETPQDEEQVGGEDYYYCGLCKGYLPISSFPHPHTKG